MDCAINKGFICFSSTEMKSKSCNDEDYHSAPASEHQLARTPTGGSKTKVGGARHQTPIYEDLYTAPPVGRQLAHTPTENWVPAQNDNARPQSPKYPVLVLPPTGTTVAFAGREKRNEASDDFRPLSAQYAVLPPITGTPTVSPTPVQNRSPASPRPLSAQYAVLPPIGTPPPSPGPAGAKGKKKSRRSPSQQATNEATTWTKVRR